MFILSTLVFECFCDQEIEFMSNEEFEKYDGLDSPSLDGKGAENLDEYGVWIKKRPNAYDDESLSDASSTSEASLESDSFDNADFDSDVLKDEESSSGINSMDDSPDSEAFDFDGLGDDIPVTPFENTESSVTTEDLNNVDMSDFFTDFGEDSTDEDVESEDTLKMDLNFDTMDSFEENNKELDDFDSMLSEADNSDVSSGEALTEASFTEDTEFDDFLSSVSNSPNSSTSQVAHKQDESSHEISLDVNVDEEQSFDKISDDDSSILIDSPVDSIRQENKNTKDDDDDMIIKKTVIEATNIEEIKSKNQEVLNENTTDLTVDNNQKVNVPMEDFNDVDALAKDLAEGALHSTPTPSHNSVEGLRMNVVSVEGLDKVAELLQGMTKELTSIREEIVLLKNKISSSYKGEVEKNVNAPCANETGSEHEESGFFKDEDTDEAIALTGDELNNILITADFTEEAGNQDIDGDASTVESSIDAAKDSNETEEAVGDCEICGENEKNIEDEENEFSTDNSDFEFDDITIENSKLDDFVIPEELDYNMLGIEDGDSTTSDAKNEVASVSDTDIAYLNEQDVATANLPQTQELSTETDDKSISDNVVNTVCDDSSTDKPKEELPSNIKKDIKSVLAYMDQLLESLPEEKIKEFAESEYFEMYHRLFNELGIS